MDRRKRQFLFIVSALMGLAADIATPLLNGFFESLSFLWKRGVGVAESGSELFRTTEAKLSEWLDAQLTQPVSDEL